MASKESIERMKQVIADKKKSSSNQGYKVRLSTAKIGGCHKGFKSNKTGGLFDK